MSQPIVEILDPTQFGWQEPNMDNLNTPSTQSNPPLLTPTHCGHNDCQSLCNQSTIPSNAPLEFQAPHTISMANNTTEPLQHEQGDSISTSISCPNSNNLRPRPHLFSSFDTTYTTSTNFNSPSIFDTVSSSRKASCFESPSIFDTLSRSDGSSIPDPEISQRNSHLVPASRVVPSLASRTIDLTGIGHWIDTTLFSEDMYTTDTFLLEVFGLDSEIVLPGSSIEPAVSNHTSS